LLVDKMELFLDATNTLHNLVVTLSVLLLRVLSDLLLQQHFTQFWASYYSFTSENEDRAQLVGLASTGNGDVFSSFYSLI